MSTYEMKDLTDIEALEIHIEGLTNIPLIKGDKGEKGDKGDKGDRGLQGPQGAKGDKGNIGPQGIQGPQGKQGEKGEDGIAYINKEVEGQSIHIEDSSDLEGQLEVLGNVEQDTREGYNQFNNMATNGEYNGVTRIVNKDKSITFNGNSLNSWANYKIGEFKGENKKYILSGSPQTPNFNKIFLTVHSPNGTDIAQSKNGLIAEFIPKTGVTYEVICAIAPNTNLSNINFKPMITTESNKEKPYEQYGASPSPEYPSEIRTVGDKGSVEIKKINKNLAPNLKDGKLEKQSTFICNCKKGESFTLSVKGTAEIDNRLSLRTNVNFAESIDEYVDQETLGLNGTQQKMTITSTIDGILYIRAAANVKRHNIEYLQIENGKVATEIVEHQEETKILPIQKPMLEGDYFIKEVDGWKEVHNWGKKVFDGTENWDTYEDTQPNTIDFGYNYRDGQKNFVGLSNYFIPYNTDYMPGRLDKDIEGLVIRYNYIKISRFKREIPNVESLKKWLKDIYDLGKPLYVYYKLDVPTKLPCTPEQTKILDELDNFQTYKPVTNITTDSIAKLKLKYKADIETYIRNLKQGPKGDTGPQGLQGKQGPKGDAGSAAGFGTVTATIDNNVGIPTVEVTTGGSNTAKTFNFSFKNLKGDKGDVGPQGATGETGPQGTQGAQGKQGIQGERGPQGIQGPKGEKGDTGPQATISITKKVVDVEIVKNTNYTVPQYTLNNNSLSVFFEGCKLIKDVNYIEKDITHIQFKDWNVPKDSNLEFIIRK